MAYNSCVIYFSQSHWYSNSSTLHQGSTKYNQRSLQKKLAEITKHLMEKKETCIEVPRMQCCLTPLTYLFYQDFQCSLWRKEQNVSALVSTLLLTLRTEIVTKSYPVSLWWLTRRWGVSLQALFQLFQWFTKCACNT